MPNIKNVTRDDTPSPQTDHIIIELVNGGFQAGCVRTKYEAPQIFKSDIYPNYIDALRKAMEWSNKHVIPDIFVIGEADADRT